MPVEEDAGRPRKSQAPRFGDIGHAVVRDDKVHADDLRGLAKALKGHLVVGAAVNEQDLGSHRPPSPTSRAASSTSVGTCRSGGAKKAG